MNARSCSTLAIVLASTIACLTSALNAQVIVAPALQPSPVLPSSTVVQAGNMGDDDSVAPDLSSAPAGTSSLPLFQAGPFGFRPHARYRIAHGEGLLAGEGERVDTTIHAVSPGILINAGSHWTADYTATWTRYTNDQLRDNTGHRAYLSGVYGGDRTSLSVGGNYSMRYGTLIETASQSREIRYGGRADVQTRLSNRVFLDFGGARSYRKANSIRTVGVPLSTVHDTSLRGGATWAATQRTRFSTGANWGRSARGEGREMTHITPYVGVGWSPTDRINVSAQAGYERRRFDGDARKMNSAVYSGAVRYRAFERTSIDLSVDQSVGASYIGNSVTKARNWRLGLHQVLFELVSVSAGVSRRELSYLATVGSLPVVREDDVESYDARAGIAIFERGSFAVFWSQSRNSSSVGLYSFRSQHYGAEIGYRF